MVSVMAGTEHPADGHIIAAFRRAADNVEQHLAKEAGLQPSQVAVLMHVALHQPATIPAVAAGIGHGYRWAMADLADLRRAGLVIRWPSNPARFALSDAGTRLADRLNNEVWDTIVSALGWPAAVIAGKVLDILSDPVTDTPATGEPTAPPSLSNAMVAARFLRVEPHVIDAWLRSGTLPPPPWSEEDLRGMSHLPRSVIAVWPDLLEGARSGRKFADVAKHLGVTTQKVAATISRDSALRAQLDEALMQGRDPKIRHGQRLAYREGCWCSECRRAPLQGERHPLP